MQIIHKINIVLMCSLTAAMVLGCGGGGGGGGGGGTESTLDAEAVGMLASHLIDNDICVATDGGISSSSASSAGQSSSASSTGGGSVSSSSSSSSYNPFPAEARGEWENDETYYGALGGTMNKHTHHKNGTTTRTYDLKDFKNPMFGKPTGLSGSYEIVDHGKPGEYGPIVSNTTAQTKGAIDAVVDENARDTTQRHYTVEVSGYNLVYTTEIGKPHSLKLLSAVLTDKDKSKKFSVTNVKADAAVTSEEADLWNLSATYTDPDVGTLKVRSEGYDITIDRGEKSVQGSVELTATDGTKASIKVDSSMVTLYTVDANGNKTMVEELSCQKFLP